MKKAFIAGTEAEVNEAIRSGDFTLLCANRKTFDYAVAKNVPALELDEERIHDLFAAGNRWAYETLLAWIAREEDPPRRFFLNAYFYDWRTNFARCFKFILVFERLLAEHGFETVSVPDDGASLLPAVLSAYFGPKVRTLLRSAPSSEAPPLSFDGVARGAASFLANLRAERLLNAWKKEGRLVLAASGSLRHLKPLLDRLPEIYSVVFFETRFNREKEDYCRSKGFACMILPDRERPVNPFAAERVFFKPNEARFESRDLSGALNAAFARAFAGPLVYRPFEEPALEDFLARVRPESMLLDEDSATRRLPALVAERRGIPSHTISHGIMTARILPLENYPPARFYDSGTTFVQSPMEREVYQSFYYDDQKIALTGIPRYDRLAGLKAAPPARDRKTIVYCGSSMVPYDFAKFLSVMDVLGPKTFCRDLNVRYFQDLLRIAIQDNRIFLRFKAHFSNDEEGWDSALAEFKSEEGKAYELLPHDHDTFALLADADLVVTPESTVVSEALMLDKPVIVMNYTPLPLTSPYDKKGVVEHVRDEGRLSDAVGRCLFDSTAIARLAKARQEHAEYFTGKMDGKATERVAGMLFKGALLPRQVLEKARS